MQEFLDDVMLVFENCESYFGFDSTIVQGHCKKVRSEFEKLCEQFNAEFYCL